MSTKERDKGGGGCACSKGDDASVANGASIIMVHHHSEMEGEGEKKSGCYDDIAKGNEEKKCNRHCER